MKGEARRESVCQTQASLVRALGLRWLRLLVAQPVLVETY